MPPKANVNQIIVGREATCNWCIAEKSVSRVHCHILIKKNRLLVSDQNSKNGTYINSIRLKPYEEKEIHYLDSLRIGTATEFSCLQIMEKIRNIDTQLDVDGIRKLSLGAEKTNDIIIPGFAAQKMELTLVASLFILADIKDELCGFGEFGSSGLSASIDTPKMSRAYFRVVESIFGLIDSSKQQLPCVMYLLRHGDNLVGRDASSDICINDGMASRRHAIIKLQNNKLFISDLESRNGTRINGEKIAKHFMVSYGDEIKIGETPFVVGRGESIIFYSYSGAEQPLSKCLYVNHLSYVTRLREKSDINLLNDVCLSIDEGELVGIIGQSGSGKTTLLKLITGIYTPTSGSVVLNIKADDPAQNTTGHEAIGYVPCDDIIHSDLTVYEALYYNYKFRTPSIKKIDVDNGIMDVLGRLRLMNQDNAHRVLSQIIGDAGRGGLSTGQKKRVQLALEIIGHPNILLVDEPTSGLSSEDAIVVIDIFKELTTSGCSIVCTLHQPSMELYKKLDKIAVIHRGNLVYFGPAFPDALKYFNQDLSEGEYIRNPDCVLSGLIRNEEKGVRLVDRYKSSKYYEDVCENEMPIGSPRESKPKKRPLTWFSQLVLLLERNAILKLRDKVNTITLLAQAPVIALLIASVFYFSSPPHLVPLYLMIIASIWFGTTNSVREIVGEVTINNYEFRSGVAISAYVLSKFIILSLLCAFQCACMVLLVSWFIDLTADKISLILILYLASLCGLGIGLLISSLCQNQQRAISIIPLILIPMVVLGGGMIYVSKMDQWSKKSAALMPSRWAYEYVISLVDAESTINKTQPVNAMAAMMYGDNTMKKESIILILLSMITSTMVVIIYILRRRKP